MSQPKKRDIADFFRPFAKTIPRKRPTPEPDDDDDTIVVEVRRATPTTPSTNRTIENASLQETSRTPTGSRLVTPRSGRSVSIPIRSPANRTPTTTLKRKPLFEVRIQEQPSPKQSSSFSFADLPSSSRRVTDKDGDLVAVRDSDDSDDSLESLSDLFSRKKKTDLPTSSGTDKATDDEMERLKVLNMFTGGRTEPHVRRQRIRELQKMERANKLDLSSIFDDERKEQEVQAKVTKASAELEASTREIEHTRQAELDQKMVEAILRGESNDMNPENAARLISAVQRTEAFPSEKSYSFFGRAGPSHTRHRRKGKQKFPKAAIPSLLWGDKDDAGRDRAFLSGLVTELAQNGMLEDEALRWTFEATIVEDRDEIRHSYLQCISVSSNRWTRANVTPEDIQTTFDVLGADIEALRDGTEILMKPQLKRDFMRWDYKHLLIALKLFTSICQDMDFASLSKLCSIVSRLSLDQDTMSDNQVCLAVEDLLEKLINLTDMDSRQHVHDRLLSDLSSNLKDPILQAQFFHHFIPTTSTAACLRTQLAAIFLLDPAQVRDFSKPPSTSTPLVILSKHLSTSPPFQPRTPTSKLTSPSDYHTLTSLSTVFDAALADGHPPAAGFWTKNDESIFNSQVDTIAAQIRDLYSSIGDSGASHMRRTEAKETLQGLHQRLLYNVRTRTKAKRHVFDPLGKSIGGGGKRSTALRDAQDVEHQDRGRDFMAKFLAKRKERQGERPTEEIKESVESAEKVEEVKMDYKGVPMASSLG